MILCSPVVLNTMTIGSIEQGTAKHWQQLAAMFAHLSMVYASGPGAPRFRATCTNAPIRLPSLATSSMVIAGRVCPGLVLDLRHRIPGWGCGSARPSTGNGPLRACRLPRETDSVGGPVQWPWSASLPARGEQLGPPFDGLPGTARPSDSSRLFAISSFGSLWLPPAGEAERSPRVRAQDFVPTPSPIRQPARLY
jgi:hypothetical protein